MLRLVTCCIAAALSLGTVGAVPAQSEPPLFARFKETVRADPQLLSLARQVQADAGSARKAIPGLIAFTRSNPRNAEAWWLLGLAYANTDQQELSDAASMRAATLKPELNEMTRQLAASGMMGARATTPSADNTPSGAAKQRTAPSSAGRPSVRGSPDGKIGGQELLNAALVQNAPLVKSLLARGADPNFQDDEGYTPLMRAASSGNVEVVRLLLEAGANVSLRNQNGFTASTYAQFHPQAQSLIISAGGTIDPKPGLPKQGEANYCKAMYGRTYSLCDSSDRSCKMFAADKWSTCNKTGRWP